MPECSEALLYRGDARRKAGLVARGGVLVQRALLDRFVEGGDGLPVGLLGGGLIALRDGFAELAQLATQLGRVRAITFSTGFGLARAFLRRKMICHVWFVTFVPSERYSGGSEFLIIGEHLQTGQ